MAHGPAPSLVQLCIEAAIDNLSKLGDVGELELHFLEVILPHCTTEQLKHIEDCTQRDLSSVTNELWKKCYGRDFGQEHLENVMSKLRNKRTQFMWRALYEAKQKSIEEKEKKGVELLQQLCAEEVNKKQSRQIKMCSKVPPDNKKRFFGGGSGPFANVKGRLMKKARVEHAASSEKRMMTSIRKQQQSRFSGPGYGR